MVKKLKSIHNIPFLTCLLILLLNDFYLKYEFHNVLTGKLSDFCGLFVFVSFWSAIFPKRKLSIYGLTAILFVIWKSPMSQEFIDFFRQNIYPIQRVVDITDLWALVILPLAYFYHPKPSLSLNPIPLSLLSVFSFCATSLPEPQLAFEQPQYLLFKSGIGSFEPSRYPSNYELNKLDSLLIIDIKEIRIDQIVPLEDDIHKVKILKDLDLRFLRESKGAFRSQIKLSNYAGLRDSLTIRERSTLSLKTDSFEDHLNFKGTRLDGLFSRISNNNLVLIKGNYKNGLEDSIWSFYNSKNELILKKYFENGILTKKQALDRAVLKEETKFHTRNELIRNKQFLLIILGIVMLTLIILLIWNHRKWRNKEISDLNKLIKITATLLLPLASFILAKFLSVLIPHSYSSNFMGLYFEVIVVFLLGSPFYATIIFIFKPKNLRALVFSFLLFSVGIIFIEEWFYLKDIMDQVNMELL